MSQRVCGEDGLGGLGGAPRSGPVNGTHSELVHGSFLEPKHRALAGAPNALVAAHPLAPTEVTPERDI